MKPFLAVLSALLFLVGCNIDKRNQERMEVYAVRYPSQFKILTNTLDPCFNGIAKSDTVVVKGKPDTVITPGGTTTITSIKKDTVYVTKTVYKTVIQPVTKTIHDTVSDNRALQSSQAIYKIKSDSLVTVKAQLKQTSHSESIWRLFTLVLGVFIIGFIVIKVYTLFSGGGEVSAIKKLI